MNDNQVQLVSNGKWAYCKASGVAYTITEYLSFLYVAAFSYFLKSLLVNPTINPKMLQLTVHILTIVASLVMFLIVAIVYGIGLSVTLLCGLQINEDLKTWQQFIMLWPILLLPYAGYNLYFISFKVPSIYSSSTRILVVQYNFYMGVFIIFTIFWATYQLVSYINIQDLNSLFGEDWFKVLQAVLSILKLL